MKSNTSMNVMLVVFCAILVVFVFVSSKVSEQNKTSRTGTYGKIRIHSVNLTSLLGASNSLTFSQAA